jgi:hypothetical protein
MGKNSAAGHWYTVAVGTIIADRTLTGGKSGPAPAGSTYPPGTQVGNSGIAARPATGSSGPRIDIPANGDKPHETLHYPKVENK